MQEYLIDIQQNLEWLRNNVQPWSRVLTSWQVTTEARIEQLKVNSKGKNKKSTNIQEYIKQYSALNILLGYSLVCVFKHLIVTCLLLSLSTYSYVSFLQLEIDFEKLYPASILKFYGEWPKLYNFILRKLQNDSTIKQEQLTIGNNWH